ncbi:hypothetical protein ACFY5K_34685 [Streptomyces griseofuscus]|uniref:hypothetical protein n=1 Tax=Streptomyces griseofuscus TaxID=146922 RepID=UPI00369DDD1C
MNHDAEDDNGSIGDNAPFFFDRYPAETAQWLAEIGDEANDKAGDNAYEFRKISCDLFKMALRDGVTHAFIVADHFIAPNSPAAKYLEERYGRYDAARSAVIMTGTGTGPATTQTNTEAPGTAATGTQTSEGKDGQDADTTAATGTAGTTTATDNGATITVTGCGGGAATTQGGHTAGNTGIGQQGTLFVIYYSEWRATIPTRRSTVKAENRRLINVAKGTRRQIELNENELKFLDLAEAADAAGLEDLVNTHRNETSIAGVLRAAGMTPQELGLTNEAVTWMDTQLKVA